MSTSYQPWAILGVIPVIAPLLLAGFPSHRSFALSDLTDFIPDDDIYSMNVIDLKARNIYFVRSSVAGNACLYLLFIWSVCALVWAVDICSDAGSALCQASWGYTEV